ncbi:5-oxoprolinase subunit PxpB [Brevibacillus sp. SAFN-007a]|uniref:5-oxoprolinase subunit PxpB n=1 Tax=Brevibacillus sp. SAFN-007a TaxID=3436862 RepID=UPI003F7F693A
MEQIEFFPLGDSGIVVKLGDTIDQTTQQNVQALADHLEQHPLPGMVEFVPGYTSVTVYYDPVSWYDPREADSPYDRFKARLARQLVSIRAEEQSAPRLIEIPVCYGGVFGPDLPDVAAYHGMTPDEVIRIHSGQEYLVHMIGFAPGFPYLGGLDKRLATPRRQSPRTAIAPGSVGIGGEQTGVYPIESPGGWHIIGRTPERLFRPEEQPPSLLRAGDRVRFCPIAEEAYEQRGRMGT